MSFSFSARSLKALDTVHEDMQRLVHKALSISPIDFVVIQGLRTVDQQARLFGQGRTGPEMAARKLPIVYAAPLLQKVTWTMQSNHMTGRAVDIAPWVGGKLILPPRPTAADIALFTQLSVAMKRAAMEECLVVGWGGDWHSTKDYPHFELLNKAGK